jgi:hypothetical protein
MIDLKIINRLISLSIILLLITCCFTGVLLEKNLNLTNEVEARSTWMITTDSDFNNGTFENIEVTNTGSKAELKLKPHNFWTDKLQPEIPAIHNRQKISSIYGSDKVLFFGGDRFNPNSDTRIFDYSQNRFIQKFQEYKPDPRGDHAMAPIYGTDKVLLFGGIYEESSDRIYYDDTWIYDVSENNWTNKEPGEAPNKRILHKMASVWGDDKVILIGGYCYEGGGNSIYYNDLWIYDLNDNTWTQKTQSKKPSIQDVYGMSSIYGTDKIVILTTNYYDYNKGNIYGETWIYDVSDNKWTNNTKQNQITPLSAKEMTSIHGTDKVLSFGGFQNSYTRDTWIYDLSDNEWSKRTTISTPAGFGYQKLATIYGTDLVLLIGSVDKAIWTYDLSENNWINISRIIAPNGRRIGLTSVYGTDKIIHFGGDSSGICNDLWIFDFSDSKWVKKIQINKPKSRYMHSIASIYGTDKILLFGGRTYDDKEGYSLNDTWLYDLSENKWTERNPTNKPRCMYNHKMVSIHGTDKILLLTRYQLNGTKIEPCNYSWIYDLSENSWKKVSLSKNISLEYNFALASVYGDDKVMLFGGGYISNNSYKNNETWIYDLSDDNWSKMSPKSSPPGGYCLAMSNIQGTDKIVLFIGKHEVSETWIYDLSENNWILKTITSNPDPYYQNYLVPIYGTQSVFLYEGIGYYIWSYDFTTNFWNFKIINEYPSGYKMVPVYGQDKTILIASSSLIWIYDFGNNCWEKKYTTNMPTSAYEFEVETIYNSDKILFYNGRNRTKYLKETWIYDLSENKWIQKHPKHNPGGWEDFDLASIHGTDCILFVGDRYNHSSREEETETWIYDLSKNDWIDIKPSGDLYVSNLFLMASISNTDMVLLIEHEKTWIYDYSENTWTIKSTNRFKPELDYEHEISTIFNEDKVVVYGKPEDDYYGIQESWEPETWIYDLSDNSWTKHFNYCNPGYGYYQAMAPVFGTNKVVHFGGRDDTLWVLQLDCFKNGSFLSDQYYVGKNVIFRNLIWNKETNINTNINFQIRSGISTYNISTKDFVGPDGTITTYYNSTPAIIWEGHNNDSYVQLKAFLNTNNIYQSPTLEEVILVYNTPPYLNGARVFPRHGDVTSEFNFKVYYNDVDNDPPKFVFINIDGINYSMNEYYKGNINYSDGKAYWYETKLNVGNHTFQYFSSDGDVNCSTEKINLSVTPGPLHRIAIYPPMVIMEVGENKIFKATGYDIENNSISINPYWSVNGGGEVDKFGNFKTKTIGTYTISAYYKGISANATVIIFEKNDDVDTNNGTDFETNTSERDSDKDGIPDDWEERFGLNKTNPNDAFIDTDNDNLLNLEEYFYNTDPTNPDTDNDTFLDGDEIKIFKTDPLVFDIKSDNKDDDEEIEEDTDPLDEDDYPNKRDNNDELGINFTIYLIIIIVILILLLFSSILKMYRTKARNKISIDQMEDSKTSKIIDDNNPPKGLQRSSHDLCTSCNQSLTYNSENNKYYCPQCKKYEDSFF